MEVDPRLRLDYEQTTQLYRTLVDVRFKLLALVPTLSGIAVAVVGTPRPPEELAAVGLLGLVATLGILLYELRNTEIHDAVLARARMLEERLELLSVHGPGAPGGLFAEWPPPGNRRFGGIAVFHDRALALVYGAALAGWAYLTVWGVLGVLDVSDARTFGAILGALVGLLAALEVVRSGRAAG